LIPGKYTLTPHPTGNSIKNTMTFLSLLTFMHNWVVYLLVSHIISLTFVVIENILNIFSTNIFSDSGGEKKDKKKAKEAEKEGLNR
jgi:hypothetical protein